MSFVLGTANFGFNYNSEKLDKKEVFKILECFEKNGGTIVDTSYNYGEALSLLQEYGWKGKIVSKIWNIDEFKKTLDILKTDKIYSILAREVNLETINFLRDKKQKGIIEKFGLSIMFPTELTINHFNIIEIPLDKIWFEYINIISMYSEIYVRSFYNLFMRYNYNMNDFVKLKNNKKIKFVVGVENCKQVEENFIKFKGED